MDRTPAGQPGYHSYLLRLWHVHARGTWCASLQSTATEQLIRFATVEELFTFLVAQLAPEADPGDAGAERLAT